MRNGSRNAAVAALAIALLAGMPTVLVAADDDSVATGTHLLEAEMAMDDGDYLRAVQEYVTAARLSDSVQLAEQATVTAFRYRFNDETRSAAQRWLELDPEADQPRFYLAMAELRLGNIHVAKQGFEQLLEQGNQPPDQRLYSILGAFDDEDPVKVDQLVRELAKPYEDSALTQHALGVVALQAGDLEQAKKCALKAAEIDPEWIRPKLLYARALLLGGESDEAVEYTARIVGDDPDADPDARMELALMYMSVGRNDDALSQVNQVLLEQASNSDALRLMAIINFQEGNFDAARDDFEDLLASRRHTMDALYYLARIADFHNETERAIQLYSQVTDGQYVVPSQRRASALIAVDNEEPDFALQRLDEFAAGRPEYAVDMVVSKAILLAQLERYDEALAEYDRAVSFRPDDENIALGRAELMLQMNRVDDAIAAYRAAAKRWPESSVTLNALGYTLADRSDQYREAERLIRKSLKLDPENPAIIDSLGWVLYKRGRYDDALEQLEVAYKKYPDHEVAAHLIEVLATMKRTDEALQLLEAAEKTKPDSPLLQGVRERFFPDRGE